MKNIGLIQLLRLVLLTSVLLLASSAEGAALRLAPSTDLLLGGTPPPTADEASPIEWNLGDYAAALILGDLGVVAGAAVGIGAAVFAIETVDPPSLNEAVPLGMAVGLSVGAVSVVLLTALAVKVYADAMGSRVTYGSLVAGAAFGLFAAVLTVPAFPVTVFIFPALFSAFAAADFEPQAASRVLGSAPAAQPALGRSPDRGLPPTAIAPVFQARF